MKAKEMKADKINTMKIKTKTRGVKTCALRAAFPNTVPVLTGYIILGMAFGILMDTNGFHIGVTILMSLAIYAGSMQFVAINLLTAAVNPVSAFFMTLMVNARHLFYGIAMLEKFKGTGKKKPYLIFGLTDETFSLLCMKDPPQGVDKGWFMFFITFLDQLYWVTGSILGGLLGSVISFDTKGIEFVMTALFVTIFTGQWKHQKRHGPAIIGLVVSFVCLILFGPSNFIIPSMALIVASLTLLRGRFERGEGA